MSIIPIIGFFICTVGLFIYSYIQSLNECILAFKYVCVHECTYGQ
jgi:predicted PurR-regulated permease PerM